MASDFPETSLQALAAQIPNATAAGPFGSNLVSRDYVPAGVPVIRGQNLMARWVSGEFVYVSQEKAQALRTNTARPGDVVFTQRGTLGQVAMVPPAPFDRYVISQSQMKLTVDEAKADARFVYYACRTEQFLKTIHDNAVAAGVPHINLGTLRRLAIPCPSPSLQVEIANVLSALDDRIDHNCALAANLETIARALFKSWFVDFNPVRAKAAGEAPPGLAPDLAALFPDRFVDSALGEIPEGWEFTPLSKLAEFVNGRNFTKEATGSGRVVIRIAELSNGGPSGNTVWNDLPDTEDRYVANPGDVLFAWSGSLGVHVWEHDAGLVNQHIFKVLPRSGYCKPFCFFAIEEIIEDFRAIASGKAVTMGHIKRGDLDTHGVFCPSAGTLTDAFSNLVDPIWERIRVAHRESLALTAMRDLLLPRLISGKLRVEDAQAPLEAA